MLDDGINVGADDTAHGRLSSLLRLPLGIMLSLALRRDDGQSILPAEFIRGAAHIVVVALRAGVVFVAVDAGNGIDHQMIVQMVLIQMGAHDNFKVIPEQTPRKFFPDLMRLLRRDLSRCKGLNEVVAEDAARFPKPLLGFRHLGKSGVHAAAVQRGSEEKLLRFFWVCDIGDAGRQRGLFAIGDIVHPVIQPLTNGKNLRVCHYPHFTALHNAACISMML